MCYWALDQIKGIGVDSMLDFKTEFYSKLFQSLDNNSVLMHVEADGRYRLIWCSREYTEMMEGTEEECIRYESGEVMNSIHPDDRNEVAYLFQNHDAPDGTNSMTIRKTTVKGNLIWVCVHYAFLEEDGVQYAYCTYFDVTELKENQQQTRPSRTSWRCAWRTCPWRRTARRI